MATQSGRLGADWIAFNQSAGWAGLVLAGQLVNDSDSEVARLQVAFNQLRFGASLSPNGLGMDFETGNGP